MLPSEIPLFPLPNVALFPATLLPLHIFEPRYRAMVTDALDGERLIGIVMLRPGWEPHYEHTPDVYSIGCAGFITHAERSPDGRYNIMLRGMEKFRIVEERRAREGVEMYRVAHIDSIAETPAQRGAAALADARTRLERLIAQHRRDDSQGHSRRRPGPRHRAAPGAPGEAGAPRVQRPAAPLPHAHRTARDADDGDAARGKNPDALRKKDSRPLLMPELSYLPRP
jgi:Lon protease-like protein